MAEAHPDPAYPYAPGSHGTDTSISAAEDLAPKVGRLQQLVLEEIRYGLDFGRTTNEVAELLGIDRGSIQPRTSELRLLRLIVDSGKRRQNANGKSAIVWVAREHAR